MQETMIKGTIIKGIAGFYYVHIASQGIYECKAKGSFRNENKKPLVGDVVEIAILDEPNKLGNIETILPRKNELIRPAVANVDQALVIFSITKPDPTYNLLDRFLIMMKQKKLPIVLCFNKEDLATEEQKKTVCEIYKQAGIEILLCSAKQKTGIRELKDCLHGKITTVAGPSGVGKSSLINCLQSDVTMEIGTISKKIDRGKHTTRHSELLCMEEHSYIMDTPGFTSLHMFSLEKEELSSYYTEFAEYEGRCRFQGCSHIHEPDCAVKKALEDHQISKVRYETYQTLYKELKEKRKY